MKAFLPLNLQFGDIVLSPDLAVALETLHDLVHTTQSNMKANLPEVLEKATQLLTTKILQSYHKPITRVGSMTHFKRLLKEGHQLVVNAKLDKEADEKAVLVKDNLKKVSDFVSVLDSHASETLDFSIVASVLQDWFMLTAWRNGIQSNQSIINNLSIRLTRVRFYQALWEYLLISNSDWTLKLQNSKLSTIVGSWLMTHDYD